MVWFARKVCGLFSISPLVFLSIAGFMLLIISRILLLFLNAFNLLSDHIRLEVAVKHLSQKCYFIQQLPCFYSTIYLLLKRAQ